MKVAVGMSGGVDSSVSALLLKEMGYKVIGITLKLSSMECVSDMQVCCSPQDVKDAKKVAQYLGIEHYVIDWEDLFKGKVIDYFVNEYKKGNTPNPCSICNREIKTGLLARYVKHILGADKLATGHYIRLEYSEKYKQPVIKRGKDKKKDQSYFMALVDREILDYLIFPLGNYTKEQVREIAKDYNLPVFSKKDSFEICFTAGKTPAEYLKEYNLYNFKVGDIIHISGKVIGKHKGLPFYTIGQRRGLGIQWQKPLYVIDKREKENILIVGEREYLLTDNVKAKDFNFLVNIENWNENLCIQGRYKQKCLPIKEFFMSNDEIVFKFRTLQEKFAKGQILAVYDNEDILLGGGVIAS